MSSPQLENGYIKIATEIFDAFGRFRIPGVERQILDIIIRKTYGYNKKEDWISNSQFVLLTGLKKGNICKAINSLVYKNIVIKKDNGRVPSYQFNKDYKSWRQLSKKKPVIKKETIVIKSDNKVLSKKRDTKDIKDNIQKDNNAPFRALKFLTDHGIEKEIAKDWLKVRKTKRLTNTERAFNTILEEIKKTGQDINFIIGICVDNSWGGFKESWPWQNSEEAAEGKVYEVTPEMEAHMEKLKNGNL